jgi:hypothetical protein
LSYPTDQKPVQYFVIYEYICTSQFRDLWHKANQKQVALFLFMAGINKLAVIQRSMIVQKKNFKDFYKEIRQGFPRINDLDTWNKYDSSVNGYEHSLIMSELSEEMARWVVEGQNTEAQRLMDKVERYFNEGDVPVTSIIYTDFLVTIMEAKREPRELIKKMMGPETEKHYKNLFTFYRELDT